MPSLAGENSVSTLSGYFKEVYGELDNLIPEATWLQKNVKFSEANGVGNSFHTPVILTQEHGVTYAAANSGAFALSAAVAATMKDATVQGSQVLLRSRLDYESAARAGSSKKAFGDATKLLVENMIDSIAKRMELMFLYGRSSIGTLNAAAAANTFVISQATWSAALWAGMEGAKIDILDPDLSAAEATSRTVTAVDISTRTITIDGAVLTCDGDEKVFFAGAVVAGGTPTYNECLGLDGIINIGSGTDLFGINPQTYSLWKGNTSAVGGALTVTKVMTALMLCVGKGLMEDVVLLINPVAFQGLLNPLVDATNSAGARKIDASYNKTRVEVGSNTMTIYGGHGAKVEVVPHLFVKEGEGFMFPKSKLKRIGATDVTFKVPGRGDEFFLHVPDAAGYELRCYANQALFLEQPGRTVKLTGIS